MQLEVITLSPKGRPFMLPALVQQAALETNTQQDRGQPGCALHPQVTGSPSTSRTEDKRGPHWTMGLIEPKEGGGGSAVATLRFEVVS